MPDTENTREDLQRILTAGLDAADPKVAVANFLSVTDGQINVDGESFPANRVLVLSVGKAAGAMAEAAGEIMPDIKHSGLVVTRYDHRPGPISCETLSTLR